VQEIKKIEFRKVRDFSQKFNATFEFLRQEFKPLLYCVIYIAGPFIVLGGIMGAYYQKNSLSLIDFSSFSEELLGSDFWISAVVMLVFSMLAYIFIFAALNEYIKLYKASDHVRSQEVWTAVKQNLTGYISSALALMVLMIFAMFAGGMILGGLIVAANIILLNVFLFFAMMLGIMFLVIIIYLSYITYNNEDIGIIGATNRVFKLLKGNWFDTLGLFIVAWIMTIVLNIIFSLPNMIMTSIGVFHSIESKDTIQLSLSEELLFGFTAFISSTGGFFVSIILMLVMIFQYYSLVEKREAHGLLNRIEEMGNKKQDEDEEHY